MEKEIISLSERESYRPNRTTLFLWWLSTAEKELIIQSVVDRNRFKIIGTTVLTTWIFASLAWTYFFSTVISNVFVYVSLGLFMGFVILTIDRALIKGISKSNKNKILPLAFRAILALTIGVFMAQPALLFMFDKEIKLQTMLDNEQKKKLKTDNLNLFYKAKKAELITDINTLQNQNNEKTNQVDKARQAYISEADGSGGTGKIGIKMIALAKKAEYDKLEDQLKNIHTLNDPRINEDIAQLKSINTAIAKEENQFAANFNDGFLTRIEALNNLIKNNSSLAFRYYLLVVILMLIELMPVIAKSLLPSALYEEKVRKREEIERVMVETNYNNELELKKHYSAAAHTFDKDSVDVFFSMIKNQKEGKIQKYSDQWVNNESESIDELWSKMKKDVITKNEN